MDYITVPSQGDHVPLAQPWVYGQLCDTRICLREGTRLKAVWKTVDKVVNDLLGGYCQCRQHMNSRAVARIGRSLMMASSSAELALLPRSRNDFQVFSFNSFAKRRYFDRPWDNFLPGILSNN
jgi:hypothetical protein